MRKIFLAISLGAIIMFGQADTLLAQTPPLPDAALKRSYCHKTVKGPDGKPKELCRVIFVGAGEKCELGWSGPDVTPCPCPDGKGECIPLDNPLQSEETDLNRIIGNLIKAALGLVGALALFMVVWGANTLHGSAGNPEKVKKGLMTLLWAAIGLLVVFGSYLLLNLILKYLAGEF